MVSDDDGPHDGQRGGRHTSGRLALDARVQEYYGGLTGWDEHARLTSRSAQGPLEHVRTQEHVLAIGTVAP